jgi:hypothetical protein
VAVQGVKGVTAVDADPVVHAMTVRVADEGAVIEVIRALNSAGFAVGDPSLKETGKR